MLHQQFFIRVDVCRVKIFNLNKKKKANYYKVNGTNSGLLSPGVTFFSLANLGKQQPTSLERQHGHFICGKPGGTIVSTSRRPRGLDKQNWLLTIQDLMSELWRLLSFEIWTSERLVHLHQQAMFEERGLQIWKPARAHLPLLPPSLETPWHFQICHCCVCFVLVLFCLFSLSNVLQAPYEFKLSSSSISILLCWTKVLQRKAANFFFFFLWCLKVLAFSCDVNHSSTEVRSRAPMVWVCVCVCMHAHTC